MSPKRHDSVDRRARRTCMLVNDCELPIIEKKEHT